MTTMVNGVFFLHIIFFSLVPGEFLNGIVQRLFNELANKDNLGPTYNSISAFLDFINLLTGSGLDNFNNKPPNDGESPEEEKVFSVKNPDQMETDENVPSQLTQQQAPQTAESIKNESLRRKIFIPAHRLKEIFKLDGEDAKEDSPLTKIEKLVEVGCYNRVSC